MLKNKRRVVFDVDDILWGLNRVASDKAGVSYDKIVTYDVNDNPLLSEIERRKLLEAYSDPSTFKRIKWYSGIEDLLKLEQKGVEVYFNSNSFNIEISELKRKQLKSVLAISDSRLIFNTISDCKVKEVGDGVWCFVDDSPHNILNSSAVHNIMLKTPWNTSEYASDLLSDKSVVMLDTLEDILKYIIKLLESS